MIENTNFKDIDDFFDKSPFEVKSNDDFDSIDSSDLNLYVKSNTCFNNWEDTTGKAGDEYINRLLD